MGSLSIMDWIEDQLEAFDLVKGWKKYPFSYFLNIIWPNVTFPENFMLQIFARLLDKKITRVITCGLGLAS